MMALAHFLSALLAIVLVAAAPATSAFAGSMAVDSAPSSKAPDGMPWADKSAYETCGHSCLYQKANENISLQAYYLVRKIQALQVADDATRLRNLAGFCMQESGADCFKRYKQLQVFALYKMRAALIHNSSSAASLQSKVPTVAMQRGAPKKAQVPYIVTFDDLKKQYSQLQHLSSPDYKRWASELPFKPSPDDFAKFKTIPRNPDNPKEGTLNVVERDGAGNIVHDEKAYRAALANYEQQMERAGLKVMANGKPDQALTRKLENDAGDESRQVFETSRRDVVNTVNTSMGRTRIESKGVMDFSDGARGPAASAAKAADQVGQPTTGAGGRSSFVTFDMEVGGGPGAASDPKSFILLQEIQAIEKLP